MKSAIFVTACISRQKWAVRREKGNMLSKFKHHKIYDLQRFASVLYTIKENNL